MKDTTSAHQDTALSGKGSDHSRLASAAGKGDPEINKNLKVEQLGQADQLRQFSDIDNELLSTLNHYGSTKEQEEAIRRLRPELALLGSLNSCLIALKFKAEKIRQALVLVLNEGEIDYLAEDRASRYKAIRQAAAIIDGVLENFCAATGLDYTKMDIKLIQDDPAIKSLDITKPKPFQAPKGATPEQCQLDFYD